MERPASSKRASRKQGLTDMKKVVIMGGGTGTFSVVTAIKPMPVKISTIIAVSDSGGSTGRIRDEFGFQPVGDLRQSLAALADSKDQEWIQKILLYRFDKGSGLKGHNLGNLILTALQDLTGNTSKALDVATQTFGLKGKVIPVTEKNVDLVIHYEDGTEVKGEHQLDKIGGFPKKIINVELRPVCKINPEANEAIIDADYIIIGPGDLYASLMAVLVVPGVNESMKKSKAKTIYISNLMTRITQTHDLTSVGHLEIIENAIGQKVNKILVNSKIIPDEILKHYASQHEFPVINDFQKNHKRVLSADLISENISKKNYEDNTYRSLLRHDPDKLGVALKQILEF